uniref:Uncharacterized protein n=1 Tax=Arundo donax TaxID=35708 RepID=A0A0A8Y5H4_ARUDO
MAGLPRYSTRSPT